jgi:hypothetical protein
VTKHRKKLNVIYKNTLREQQKEIMKLYFIKYQVKTSKGTMLQEAETSIEATSIEVAQRKLERKLKGFLGELYRSIILKDYSVIGYY